MPTMTVTQKTEVKLKPAILKKIRLALSRYQTCRNEIKALESVQDDLKSEIEGLFADADEYQALVAGVKIDDYPLKIVTGTSKSIDWDFIHKQGWMSTTQKAEATQEKPKKAYLSIKVPGEKDE